MSSGLGIEKVDSLGSAFGFVSPPVVVPPSEFCEAPTDPELVAVGGILTAAADAEKAGDKARADTLRQQARDRLTTFRASLKLSSMIRGRLAGTVGSGYHPPAGVKVAWQSAKYMELAGDHQGALGMLGEVRSALSDYAKSALSGPLDGADALAIARDLQLAGVEGPDGPLTTKLLEIARSQAHKEFENLARNLPCPPSQADLEKLFHAGRQSALLGTPAGDGPGSILGELQSASDSYIRGAAQQASGADLAKLGSQAGRSGLGDLSNQLRDGKKVDPPKCGVGVHLAFTQEYPETSTMAQGYLRGAWVFDSWSCSGFDGQWQTQITYHAVPNPAYGLGPLDFDWKAQWRPPHGVIKGSFSDLGEWAVAMDVARNPSGATLQTTVLKDIARSGDGFVIDNAMGWLDKKSLPITRSAGSQCK